MAITKLNSWQKKKLKKKKPVKISTLKLCRLRINLDKKRKCHKPSTVHAHKLKSN